MERVTRSETAAGQQPAAQRVGDRSDKAADAGLQRSLGNRIVGRLSEAPTIEAIAAGGAATPTTPVPHAAEIQRSFGRHGLEGLRAHMGPSAARSAAALGARAYARGDDLVFARPPSLRDAAHEAAHAIQQRHGHAPPDRVGRPGDPWESGAEQVAEQVARGRSAEPLLDRWAAAAGPAITAVQLLRDDHNRVIDIDQLKYLGDARNALARAQVGTYTAEGSDLEALQERIDTLSGNVGDQLGDATVDAMYALNHGRVVYYHNALQRSGEIVARLRQTGKDPENGYADPTYFERLKPYTWRLKAGVSASAALRAFFGPGNDSLTIVECQTAAQAALYMATLRTSGDAKFDAKFGRADVDVGEAKRLRLERDMSKDNPLQTMLAAPELDVQADMEVEELLTEAGTIWSAPNHRPARRGGWYYLANHRLYKYRHPRGIWSGENAIYIGRDEDGNQRFSGFGVENATEAGLAGDLAELFNQAPTPEEVELILAGNPSYWPLVLPTMGEFGSISKLPKLSPAARKAIETQHGFTDFGGLAQPAKNLDTQEKAIQALAEILGTMERIPPVQPEDLLEKSAVLRPGGVTTQSQDSSGTWQDRSRGKVTLTFASARKTTLHNLVGAYCKRFAVREVQPLFPLVRGLNLEIFGKGTGGTPQEQQRFKGDKTQVQFDAGAVITFPNPDDVVKAKITAGGFQSWGERVLDPDAVSGL